jgi:hypothetical protein
MAGHVAAEQEAPLGEYTREEILKLIEENGGPEGLNLSDRDLFGADLSGPSIAGRNSISTIRLTIKWITAILTRLLYFMVASVLLVALVITIEPALPSALRSKLASSSQAANLHQTEQGTWTTYNTSNSGIASNYVYAIAIDEEGNKWFGTNKGVSKFDGITCTTYNTSNSGLACDSINAIAIDNSGNVWIIGTSIGGVSKFDGENWTTYDKSNSGLADNYVLAIAIEGTHVKWFGGCNDAYLNWDGVVHCGAAAVSRFDGSAWTSYVAGESGLVGKKVNAIAIDLEAIPVNGCSFSGNPDNVDANRMS